MEDKYKTSLPTDILYSILVCVPFAELDIYFDGLLLPNDEENN